LAERRLRILVIEDEMLVAMNIEDMLLELGHEMAGLAGRLEHALALARDSTFDLAMLDVNLAGEPSFPVAQVLAERGIPFLFATGYGIKGISETYRDRPVLQKPFRATDLSDILRSMTV
jgi:DNA-binding response OmpR family regulator